MARAAGGFWLSSGCCQLSWQSRTRRCIIFPFDVPQLLSIIEVGSNSPLSIGRCLQGTWYSAQNSRQWCEFCTSRCFREAASGVVNGLQNKRSNFDGGALYLASHSHNLFTSSDVRSSLGSSRLHISTACQVAVQGQEASKCNQRDSGTQSLPQHAQVANSVTASSPRARGPVEFGEISQFVQMGYEFSRAFERNLHMGVSFFCFISGTSLVGWFPKGSQKGNRSEFGGSLCSDSSTSTTSTSTSTTTSSSSSSKAKEATTHRHRLNRCGGKCPVWG